jgi:hypothetical protein
MKDKNDHKLLWILISIIETNINYYKQKVEKNKYYNKKIFYSRINFLSIHLK